MAELEKYKRLLIEELSGYNEYCFNTKDTDRKIKEPMKDFWNRKTIPELLDIINNPYFLCPERDYSKIPIMLKAIQLENKNDFNQLNIEIKDIKDNIQNAADIVNLFTDIDKNRTNLEEQNKEINKRLDKVESTLEQILILLQKK